MSKYKRLYTVKLRMAHYISYCLLDGPFATRITVVILELIRDWNPELLLQMEPASLLEFISQSGVTPFFWWVTIIWRIAVFSAMHHSSFCPIRYSVGYWPTLPVTGNGELGFDSGEGAWETATTSKEGSRRVNYPILTQGGSDKK